MTNRRILLAENDRKQAERLQKMLQTLHYAVELATNSSTALERLRQEDAPEMALLNASLAPMNGIELGLDLRRRSRRRGLWLMLMADAPSADQVAMATHAGFDEFLIQPVDMQELRLRIRTGERVQNIYREIDDSANRAEFHSTHDPLTATWRREAMLDFLFKETDRVKRLRSPLSIILFDLDGFGQKNRRHGQKAGDTLLQSVIARVRRQLRSYDLLGRYANDAFLLALPGCIGADALARAEHIRQAIARRPFIVHGDEVSLTACFGVVESLGQSPLIVLRHAERALTEARLAGPNTARLSGERSASAAAASESKRRAPATPSA